MEFNYSKNRKQCYTNLEKLSKLLRKNIKTSDDLEIRKYQIINERFQDRLAINKNYYSYKDNFLSFDLKKKEIKISFFYRLYLVIYILIGYIYSNIHSLILFNNYKYKSVLFIFGISERFNKKINHKLINEQYEASNNTLVMSEAYKFEKIYNVIFTRKIIIRCFKFLKHNKVIFFYYFFLNFIRLIKFLYENETNCLLKEDLIYLNHIDYLNSQKKILRIYYNNNYCRKQLYTITNVRNKSFKVIFKHTSAFLNPRWYLNDENIYTPPFWFLIRCDQMELWNKEMFNTFSDIKCIKKMINPVLQNYNIQKNKISNRIIVFDVDLRSFNDQVNDNFYYINDSYIKVFKEIELTLNEISKNKKIYIKPKSNRTFFNHIIKYNKNISILDYKIPLNAFGRNNILVFLPNSTPCYYFNNKNYNTIQYIPIKGFKFLIPGSKINKNFDESKKFSEYILKK